MIHVSVDGNLGADAVIRKSNAGNDYIAFSVACNRKNIDGSKDTIWVGVSGPQTKLAKWLLKGTPAVVHGELTTTIANGRTYLNVYATHIRLLGSDKKQPEGTNDRRIENFAKEDDIPF